MRLTFRQQAFRVAISAAVATVVTGLTGCDRSNTPDGRAARSILNGDYQAAAKEKGASPANLAVAANGAAQEQFAASAPVYQSVTQQQLAVSEKLWQIGEMTATAQRVAMSAKSLSKYKPDAALAEVDKTVTAVRGDGQQGWTLADDVTLPTVKTAQAKINELKDKIAEIQRTLAGLKQKHDEAAAKVLQFQEQSNDAKGEEAVTLFKQAAEARKQANGLAIQVDQAQASLVPLQQDLAVAEAQSQQSAQTLDVFAGQRDAIEKGWRGVAAQIDQRNGYAGQVFAKADDAKFASVTLQAQELAQLADEYAKQGQAYQQQLDGALVLARDGVADAEKALREMREQAGGGQGGAVAKLAQVTLDPSAGRVLQGQIQYAMGTQLSGEAGLAAYEARVAEEIAQTGAALRQPVPETINDAARSKLKTEQGELLTKAGDALKGAGEVFDTAMQAPAAAPEVKRAATMGKMVTLTASARVMQTAGDVAAAKQSLDEAKALRDSLLENGGTLPGLPDTLQGAAPTTQAAAVEQQ